MPSGIIQSDLVGPVKGKSKRDLGAEFQQRVQDGRDFADKYYGDGNGTTTNEEAASYMANGGTVGHLYELQHGDQRDIKEGDGELSAREQNLHHKCTPLLDKTRDLYAAAGAEYEAMTTLVTSGASEWVVENQNAKFMAADHKKELSRIAMEKAGCPTAGFLSENYE